MNLRIVSNIYEWKFLSNNFFVIFPLGVSFVNEIEPWRVRAYSETFIE